jgi:hypothetical protein
MATVKSRAQSAAGRATSAAMMADIDHVVAGGESRFPYGTVFVASDVLTPRTIERAHSDGKALLVVDEHGNERFLPAP